MPISPSHLHQRGQSIIYLRWRSAGAGSGNQCLGGGSAGTVLRSQGTLGPVELSRWRARGIRMSTFLCSLRPGPAAARGALLNRLRFQKQIPLNGLGLGSWLRP